MKKRSIILVALGVLLTAVIISLSYATERKIAEEEMLVTTVPNDGLVATTARISACIEQIQPSPDSRETDGTAPSHKGGSTNPTAGITTTAVPPEITVTTEAHHVETAEMTEESAPKTTPIAITSTVGSGVQTAEVSTVTLVTEPPQSSTAATEYIPQMGDKKDGFVWVDGFGWIIDNYGESVGQTLDSDGDINKIVGIM